jgi:DNA polymerase-3 subunit alpha
VSESLVLAGGFDSIGNIHRAQFFATTKTGRTYLEDLLKYGGNVQNTGDSNQGTLFGETEAVDMPAPIPPLVEPWNALLALNKEKEVLGIYISGHPLDDYKYEIQTFCTATLSELENLNEINKTEVKIAGIVTHQETKINAKGQQYGVLTLEDFTGSIKIFLSGENFMRYRMYMNVNTCLFIQAKVLQRMYRTGEKELKITQIDLLDELREKKVKELKVTIENSMLSASFIQDMHELFSENQGKFRLRFIIEDPVNNVQVNMPSKTFKIDISAGLLRQLEEKNIQFELVG